MDIFSQEVAYITNSITHSLLLY